MVKTQNFQGNFFHARNFLIQISKSFEIQWLKVFTMKKKFLKNIGKILSPEKSGFFMVNY